MIQEDDRIFTETSMFDFALRIAQEAMSTAFEGKKTIQGQSLEEYIIQELEKEAGT